MSILKIKDSQGNWISVPTIKGDKGNTGNGISSAILNDDYTLTLTFTDGTTYKTPSIRGEKGEKGDKGDTGIGEKGDKGDKGDKGETGQAGRDGTDGVSPTVTITPITGGHRITITDADGTETADVMDGEGGGVKDVKLGEYSRLNDGVAQINVGNGLRIGVNSDHAIVINEPNQGGVRTRVSNAVITPNVQHIAVYYGLAYAAGDTTQQNVATLGAYTEDAKSKISEMLNGSVSVSGTTPTIVAKSGIRYVCGEVATLDFTPSQTGICDVVFTSGATATVLTVPSTIKWANGFDPTALEANTTYEINIMDGLGVACTWT